MQLKTCTKCGETKSLTDFYRNKSKKGGHSLQCKKCHDYAASRWQRNYSEHYKALKRKDQQQRQELSSATACNQGNPWEDWEELFIMADNGLSIFQKAVKLGRTYESVCTRRKYLRKRQKVQV